VGVVHPEKGTAIEALEHRRDEERVAPDAAREDAQALALAVAAAADSKKALDISILEVTELLGITDYFVISTATSRKHAQVVAEHCRDTAIEHGARVRPIQGLGASWVCADLGDVVLHVFTDDARKHYDLDELWADAPRLDFAREPSG
jgi:ribosome-associated protein